MAEKEPKILKIGEKQSVHYCVPLWQRDAQIKANIVRIKARVEPYPEGQRRTEPVAIVAFGPSLNETWEKVKDFKYVMTCSGSHKFLVDKGIIPTHHVDVDPRAHKATLLGTPQKGVEYLILSSCHKALFDLLEGFDVKLWHAFDNEQDAFRALPFGEWALSGGCSAGLRALTLARFLGFTDMHVFGMDGNEGPSGKHADIHPNQAKGHSLVECPPGTWWKTTPAFFEAAQGTFHELDQMPDVVATFYGSGLVQELAKGWTRKNVKKKAIIAIARPALISTEMRTLNARLHDENMAYGVGGAKHAGIVKDIKIKCKCDSVLDYGCGKGQLAKALPFPIWEYDPAVPGKEESPRPADLVICTDVLEHIEPDRLMPVLDDLRRCTKMIGYFVIHTGPAVKSYADGRNTHLIQHGRGWWKKQLARFFTIGKVFDAGKELRFVVSPLPKVKAKVRQEVHATA